MKTNRDIIAETIDYIENHLGDELDLNKIASIAGYSKYHLNRMFAAFTGCTIHQYIQNRRLTEAASQLVSTDKPITDIAFNTGYESNQAFTLAFRKLYKEAPQIYRKKGNFVAIQQKCTVLSEIKIRKRNKVSCVCKFNIKCEVNVA